MEVDTLKRVGLLVLVCAFCSLFLSDFVRIPDMSLQAGQIATRSIRSPIAFSYVDQAATEEARADSERKAQAVFDFDATLGSSLQNRISRAFESARRRWGEARLDAIANGWEEVPPAVQAEIGRDFLRSLQMDLEADQVQRLAENGFERKVENVATDLLGQAMRKYVVGDGGELPTASRAITVIELLPTGQVETTLTDFERINTVAEVRQALSLYALERFEDTEDSSAIRVAVSIALKWSNFREPGIVPENCIHCWRNAFLTFFASPVPFTQASRFLSSKLAK